MHYNSPHMLRPFHVSGDIMEGKPLRYAVRNGARWKSEANGVVGHWCAAPSVRPASVANAK